MEDKKQQSLLNPQYFLPRSRGKSLFNASEESLQKSLFFGASSPLFFIPRGRQRRIGIHHCHHYHLIASNRLISAHSKFWRDYVFDLGAGNRGS
ncbi:hypothetical protein M6B38_102390 [Iris pallida]|uniref:Uncharacterized protein n=1 Tax=Iris pallida TaxID=29817 RepID=A0AAX6IM42_IRIPA|nr:hypothetical protein M6B38_102390 [Iris pallida]